MVYFLFIVSCYYHLHGIHFIQNINKYQTFGLNIHKFNHFAGMDIIRQILQCLGHCFWCKEDDIHPVSAMIFSYNNFHGLFKYELTENDISN